MQSLEDFQKESARKPALTFLHFASGMFSSFSYLTHPPAPPFLWDLVLQAPDKPSPAHRAFPSQPLSHEGSHHLLPLEPSSPGEQMPPTRLLNAQRQLQQAWVQQPPRAAAKGRSTASPHFYLLGFAGRGTPGSSPTPSHDYRDSRLRQPATAPSCPREATRNQASGGSGSPAGPRTGQGQARCPPGREARRRSRPGGGQGPPSPGG